MSDNSIWGKTYRRFVENGYDQGYAAYRADEAERELSRKAKKGDVARLIGDHIADKNDVIEKLRAENERLREAMLDAADDCACGKHIDAEETLRMALANTPTPQRTEETDGSQP